MTRTKESMIDLLKEREHLQHKKAIAARKANDQLNFHYSVGYADAMFDAAEMIKSIEDK